MPRLDELTVSDSGKSHTYTADAPKERYNRFQDRISTLSRGYSTDYGIGMRLRDMKIYVFD